jgi:uncharacterized damage-inducible protein DinB
MKMLPLATHIAEIFEWPNTMLSTSELDFGSGDYQPKQLSTREDLLQTLDKNFKLGKEALENATENNLNETWALKNNGEELAKWSKYESIRHALNQITHHRAQLGVYYRMNDIPLPEAMVLLQIIRLLITIIYLNKKPIRLDWFLFI